MKKVWNFIKKKKRSILIILIGTAIFSYPYVSNYIEEKGHTEIITEYTEAVATLDEETIAEELEKAQTYNENLSGDPVHDPFIEGSGYTVPENYENVLNIYGNGVMAYIEIPEIDCYLPIYHGTDEETLEKGVGHIAQSSLPIGGTSSHAILTGHTGLPSSELFTKISKLEVGDVFYIHVLNQTLKYEIYETEVIEPDDISKLTIEDGRDLVTLVTCTPYGVNTHRLLVKGERTADDEETVEETETEDVETNSCKYVIIISCIIALVIFIVITIIAVLMIRKRKKKDKENISKHNG